MDLGFKLKKDNPKNGVGIFSNLFFCWIIKTVYKGTKKDLELQDLCKPQPRDKSEKITDHLEKHWNVELTRAKEKKCKPNLIRAILKTFIKEFSLVGIAWFVLHVILWCSQPLVLGHLLSLFSDDSSSQKDMYLSASLLMGMATCMSFLMHQTNFALGVIGMRIRIACSAIIYRKITRLNQKSLGETAAGQVVNLLSNDVNRFDLALMPLHSLWVMPFEVAYLTYIMWQKVGVSCLAGIICMAIVGLPLQGYLAKILAKYRLIISKKTDHRVKLMNEIVSGIQVLKMYAWEKPFEIMVKTARYVEIKDIKVASYIRGVFNGCVVFMERLTLCLTVICFVLLGNNITPSIVYTLAQSFNILQFVVSIMYPMAISLGGEALISIRRIEEFLLLEERESNKIESTKNKGIILSNVTTSWNGNNETLTNINIEIPPGCLCAVVGPVGAGKSSLLQILLGELVPKKGTVQIGGDLSYSSQNPWLYQSTVRNNILFGQPYQKKWYDTVVRVCALLRDFEQFPQGDKTVVGERGVSLSGGQKARINLARAIYREADIYLLDDPLSAVDTHVGRHLFDECICKHLKGKTRILVTHQLQYLKKANLIIVINNGVIEAQGTFDELLNTKLDFTKFLVDSEESDEKQDVEQEVSFKKERQMSETSELSISNVYDEVNEENNEEGNDSNSNPFKDYLLATKNKCLLGFAILLMIMGQAACTCCDLWLTYWSTQEDIKHKQNSTKSINVYNLGANSSTNLQKYEYHTHKESPKSSILDDFFDRITIDDVIYDVIKTNYAMYAYGLVIGAAVILTITRSFVFYKTCMVSSINLHSSIFHTLLKAPMRFFDTNPSGRILNRFSKDMGAIDEVLPRVLMDATGIILVMCGILVNVVISNYYMIIAIAILGGLFLLFRKWYIQTAKVIKHLEGISKSPVFSHINSTLNGIVTIRASKSEDILIEEFDDLQDVHTGSWYLLIACMSAFGLWFDIICLIFTACVTFSFVFLHTISAVNGSLVGLAISQSMILIGMLQYGMRQSAEVTNQLTSVERVLQYTKIDQEGPFDNYKGEGKYRSNEWPKKGRIQFKNLSLKYVENDPPVLHQLNFIINPGEKIGIVGRTGAGKSSLIAALFRLAPLEGSIIIDETDTKDLGLTELRKKISIIPQEPVLFSASLRYNLDPLGEFEDDAIWNALEQVELKDAANSLDFVVAEGGGNFSLGQRQLICLARAILRKNKILVLDEATANVDHQTDSFIQKTIRERFYDCTVLTIAHRLNTIMDSDRVLVMSFGKMMEFDHPHKLLQNQDGYFYKMVLETGPVMSEQLKSVAFEAFCNKNMD